MFKPILNQKSAIAKKAIDAPLIEDLNAFMDTFF